MAMIGRNAMKMHRTKRWIVYALVGLGCACPIALYGYLVWHRIHVDAPVFATHELGTILVLFVHDNGRMPKSSDELIALGYVVRESDSWIHRGPVCGKRTLSRSTGFPGVGIVVFDSAVIRQAVSDQDDTLYCVGVSKRTVDISGTYNEWLKAMLAGHVPPDAQIEGM
jgi:hypothetical protein